MQLYRKLYGEIIYRIYMIIDKNVASTIATFQLERIIEISFKLAMTTAGENFDRIYRYGRPYMNIYEILQENFQHYHNIIIYYLI